MVRKCKAYLGNNTDKSSIMENQMERTMEHDMESAILCDSL